MREAENHREVLGQLYTPNAALLIAVCSVVLVFTPVASAAQVVVTVSGTASGGDGYGVFGVGNSLQGQSFTLVFTFDDAKTEKVKGSGSCPTPSIFTSGSSPSSPATAVLTIGKGSYTYGKMANSKWGASRFLASRCSDSSIAINIDESQGSQTQGFSLRMTPVQGSPPLITSLEWRSPINVTKLDGNPSFGSFLIYHDNSGKLSKGNLFAKTITIK